MYELTLPAGTSIRRSAWVFKNTSVPSVVGRDVPRKVTLVKPVQPLNALLPILVTVAAMVMLSRLVQPVNELLGILVPPLITTVFSDVIAFTFATFPNILTNVVVTAGKVILVKPVQPWKA